MVSSTLKKIIIAFLISYKKLISPYIGNHCRFYPSCSLYSIQCFKKYNFLKAIFKTILRLIRCSPFFKGGFDPA